MTDESTVKLKVKCPICGIEKEIDVPAHVLAKKQFGTLKIQIPKGSVCVDHQFLIYVDKKGNIRSYETSDFQLPSDIKLEEKHTFLSLAEFVKMIGKFATLNVLHALFLDTPTYMVKTVADPDLEKVFNGTLYSMLPNFFKNKNEMRVISRSEFLKLKVDDHILVIDEKGFILICPWQITEFPIENDILKKILSLNEYQQQVILFQQLLTIFFRKLNLIGEMIIEQDRLSTRKIKDEFKKQFMQKKVSEYELELIVDVLKHRFNKDTSKIQF